MSSFNFKISSFLACLIAFSTSYPPQVSAKPKSSSKNSGWMINQTHRNYGDLKTTVTKNGIKIENLENDFVISTYAPHWPLLIYSEKRKLIFARAYKYWINRGVKTALSLNDNADLRMRPMIKLKDSVYCGQKCSIYTIQEIDSRGKPYPGNKAIYGEYIYTTGIEANKNVFKFAQAVFDSPRQGNLPLKLTKTTRANSFGFGLKYNKERTTFPLLDTTKIQKVGNVSIKPKLPLSQYKQSDDGAILVDKKKTTDFMKFMYDKDKAREKSR